MKSKLLHKIWDVVFVTRKNLQGRKKAKANSLDEDDRGDCDHPGTKNKKIRIATDLPPMEELEVTIHEALHACDWYKDEEWVETVADDIARLLWKLGYRRDNVGSKQKKEV